ncbi:MAG: hypothetical protein JWP87_758 [Labilithrix sp.]|nr:hypothetical protein [Labilithrix sp.]
MAGAGVRRPGYIMNHRRFAVALVLGAPFGGFWAAGCGDDEVFRDTDAGSFEAGAVPETGTPTQPDGGDGSAPSGCGSSTGAPQRLLLTINNLGKSELAAFNIATKSVDGRFAFSGGLGATSSLGTDPYVFEQDNDLIARMNAQRPWEPVSTWSVAGSDPIDGGAKAQPIGIVVPTCEKGFVLRFNRNKVAVIDTNEHGDASAAESYLDLASMVQPGDDDGLVDMTSAVYVAKEKRVYVLLGNYDRTTVGPPDYSLQCKSTRASIVAIDSTNGQLVSLGGTAPGGGIALEGYNPTVTAPLVYDAARERLLVFQGGCTDPGGAPFNIIKRGVEEIDLATRKVKTLIQLNDKGFPGTFVFMDGNRAALTFFFPNQAFFWNPSQSTLGAEIPGSIDSASHDGKGNLIGARKTKIDGGDGIEVLSVPFVADGGTIDAAAVQKLGENPFTDNTGYLGGAEVWPRP